MVSMIAFGLDLFVYKILGLTSSFRYQNALYEHTQAFNYSKKANLEI